MLRIVLVILGDDRRGQNKVRSSSPSPCRSAPKPAPQTDRRQSLFPNTTVETSLARPPLNASGKASGDIVFPDGSLYPSFVPRNANCNGQTFCTRTEDDYPADYIKKLLKTEADVWRSFFGSEVVRFLPCCKQKF